ncbi:MAG: hypothetical protein Q7W51_08540 [Coriobacteriia bacterium]|nr:hypothetical protein [Coriobacteriia bacterium]
MLDGWTPYAIIAGTAAVLTVATIVFARMAWRRQVRRYLVGLLGRREAVGAALKTADGEVRALAGGTVDDLLAFADAASEERRAVREIAERMRIEAAELADLALPKKLWPLADSLGAAASSLAEQAGRVGDGEGEPVLDALIELDLEPARVALLEADGHIAAASTAYELTDSSVYGGGLYI